MGLDPLQSAFVGGWPDFEEFSPEPLSAHPSAAPATVTNQIVYTAPTPFPATTGGPRAAAAGTFPDYASPSPGFTAPAWTTARGKPQTSGWAFSTPVLPAAPVVSFPTRPAAPADRVTPAFPETSFFRPGETPTGGRWSSGFPDKSVIRLPAPVATYSPRRA